MNHGLACGALGALIWLAAPAGAADNLLTNGSFEDKKVDTEPGYHRGAPPPTDWMKAGGIDLPDVIGNAYIDFYATQPIGYRTFLKAKDGTQFLDMNGAGTTGAIYQDVIGLTTGSTVTLSFWVGSWAENVDGTLTASLREPGAAADMASKDIKAVLFPSAATAKWTQYSISGTVGASGKVRVLFTAFSSGIDRAALGLDDVRLETQAVPEPANWAMMIGGLAMTGAAMRRRKARTAFAA